MEQGKIPVNVLKHSVLSQLHSKRDEVIGGAGIGKDCAALSMPAGILMTCQREGEVSPAGEGFLPGTVTMAHAITVCANNLAAGGAQPLAFEVTLLLPEGTEHETVKRLMQDADAAAGSMKAQIMGGQTRVTGAVSRVLAVVTGYGAADAILPGGRPGLDVVVSKWIGLEGTAVLAREYREEIDAKYPARLSREAMAYDEYLSVLPEAAAAIKSGVCLMHDASEGGIFAALWELAEGSGVGLDIDMKKLPIRQETVEIAEVTGHNPYELICGGSLIMLAEDGEQLVKALEEQGIRGTIVGKTTEGKAKILRNDDEVRYLDRPKTESVLYHAGK
jgi:hydrogenase maturation factor